MGPAILLCPSSSAANLCRWTLPASKTRQKEGKLSLFARCCLESAGGLMSRPHLCLYHAPCSEKRRKDFSWRRAVAASASASASSEVSVEEASVGGAMAVSKSDHMLRDAVQDVMDGEKAAVDMERNVVDVEQGLTDASKSIAVEDVEHEVVDATQSVLDAVESVADSLQNVDDEERRTADAAQKVVDPWPSLSDVEQAAPNAKENVVGEPPSGGHATPTTIEAALAPKKEGISAVAERTQSRRISSRSNSKKNTVVSPAELVPGTEFSGKVVSVQSFGAFVDFGAFTNGLVHISRLSKSFVRKVEDVVQVGQEVRVQLLEADLEAKRISLMLLQEAQPESQTEGADKAEKVLMERPQQQTGTPRRDPSKRSRPSKSVTATTMKVGEIVSGSVKNVIKSGVFISLPDGTDGYLPAQDVIFKGPNTNLDAQFQVGEEVTVRVLRLERGRANLSMRKEVDFDKINETLNKGVMVTGTNPFEAAFRKNEAIASYLAERERLKAQAEMGSAVVREEAGVCLDQAILPA